ncbi:MAG: glycosyltransferase family 2 protein [Chitinispirillaceae bacterium]|nr:glycosyltransferase family 2 protein [Chitinispirillaceae bacterium]
MLNNKKIVVVLPAYNAANTLQQTWAEIPHDVVDDVILVDDASTDDTLEVAKKIGISTAIRHNMNRGYGGNQKTCYDTALAKGADIVIMLHPDYQYAPKLIMAMASMIASDLYKVVLGSRILGRGALRGGMPRYKYFANRMLTLTQNLFMRQKLSEYHTGYRAFAREVLERVDYRANSDDFVFDNQMIAQIFYAGFDIAEVTCPTKYFKEASSINLPRSIVYGLGVLSVTSQYVLQKLGLARFKIFHLCRTPLNNA